MKPCAKNRERISCLAFKALNQQEEEALRHHLADCEGCRRYWEELSNVTAGFDLVRLDSNLEASETFHRRVVEKLRAAESAPLLARLVATLGALRLKWWVSLPTAAALLLAIGLLSALRHGAFHAQPPTDSLALEPQIELAPTLANYRMVTSQSTEKLMDLLTKQGNTPLPPVSPIP